MTDPIDYLVLGAGEHGLLAALRLRHRHPDARVRVVDAAARPGGSIRTRRSCGFTCELGPFAFARSEIDPLLALLQQPPTIVEGRCKAGLLFDGSELQEVAVAPAPVSFASGCEELVQACRRQLGEALWLGREVSAVQPANAGWRVVLAGEVPTEISAERLVCCLPMATAARLLAGHDPALGEVAAKLISEPRALVFLGGLAKDFENLRGHGIVPTASATDAVVETIYCSNVFDRRCLPGRFLARSELAGNLATGEETAITGAAIGELRRWTGCTGKFGFTVVHRFESATHDATWAECHARLQGLAARIANLHVE